MFKGFSEEELKRITKMHNEMLYPTVLIEANKGRGSGTVIYSQPDPDEDGAYVNYVLTNHHVIESNIQTGKVWNPMKQKDEKRDIFATCNVYFYKYKYESMNIGKNSVEADIVAYTKEEDMALLKLRSIDKIDYVAKFYPIDRIKDIRLFMKTYAVGASLGHQPIPTEGHITCMNDEIDNFVYWMSTAQVIYGNSGGSMYLDVQGDYYFIGVPSAVSITFTGLSKNAVPHMGYFIPINRVCNFLNKNYYGFIYDSNQDIKSCEEERERVKKISKAQKELLELEA